jgi:alkylation response protein AidB-like acyl-CoA dehydrogenase
MDMETHATEHHDSDDHRAFRLKVRSWLAGRLPPRLADEPIAELGDAALVAKDKRIQRLLWDGGLAGVTVPRAYGGLGLDQRYQDIFCEEASPYRLPWSFGNAFNIVLPTLLPHGSEYLKSRYIPAMLRGDEMWCQLLSEPSGGSDLAGLLTRAERRGNKWVLNGSKVWTSGGHLSDMGICLARTDPTVPKHAGLTMFLVNMHSPGMTIIPLRLILGSSDFCQEFLDDVEVPEDHVVGEVNGGWTVATTQLANERAGLARGWHMGMRAATQSEHIELSHSYIDLARKHGLTQDSHARQLIGEAFVIDAVYALTNRRVADGIRNHTLPESAGAIASLMVARTDVRRTALMSQLAGPSGAAMPPGAAGPSVGMGRVSTHRIGGGTAEMQCNLIAERHLGLPREPSPDRELPFNQLRHNVMPTARPSKQ